MLFAWHGYARPAAGGMRELVGSVTHVRRRAVPLAERRRVHAHRRGTTAQRRERARRRIRRRGSSSGSRSRSGGRSWPRGCREPGRSGTPSRPGRCGGVRGDPGVVQDLPHRGGGDLVAELNEFALYAPVPPVPDCRLPCGSRVCGSRLSWTAVRDAAASTVRLARDQPPMPGEQRRRHHRQHLPHRRRGISRDSAASHSRSPGGANPADLAAQHIGLERSSRGPREVDRCCIEKGWPVRPAGDPAQLRSVTLAMMGSLKQSLRALSGA